MEYLGLYHATDPPPGWIKKKFSHYDGGQWFHYWGESTEPKEPKGRPVGIVKLLTKFLSNNED